MKSTWSLERGANVRSKSGGVEFSVWAPNAKQVSVELVGSTEPQVHALQRQDDDVFSGVIATAAAGSDYMYRLDGGDGRPDPVSRFQPEGVHGPSRVINPHAFKWTDKTWRGIPMAELVIYELHIGTFTDDGTFEAAIARLDDLKELGVTAIEIMPVAQFPGARNWGYDGVQPFAVQNTYGGPDGLRALVNAAHERGLAVVLDVVYNHIGPEGNYLGEYGPYFTETYKTPWGPAVNYDGADSDGVRRFVIDNALYWVTEFHIDALRLDAIHGIYDFGARHILAELAAVVRRQGKALKRTVLVIGESDLNDPRVVRPVKAGGYALDGQWSDDLHHAIHSALTKEVSGYYSDFGGITPIATALSRRFVYDGTRSAYRRRRHGAPSVDVPGDRFVVCIQNHDQIGNRAFGDRLSATLTFEQLKLAASLMLLSPYVPLLFMGEEYGEKRPFQYFVSHGDEKLVDAVRKGRREEFKAFGWGDEVPDPQSEDTFVNSRLDRSVATREPHSRIRALYGELLALRRQEIALHPGAAQVAASADEATSVITLHLRANEGAEVFSAFNLSAESQQVTLPITDPGGWQLAFSTNEVRFGGNDSPDAAADDCTLPRWSARAWRRASREAN